MALAIIFGFILGFLGSMPVAGPIAVLVFGNSLRGAYRNAMSIALGAAIPEAGYAFLAFWGMGQLSARYPVMVELARGAAAVILLVIGLALALSRGVEGREIDVSKRRVARGFFLGFTIAILNPTFLATWAAAVAVLSSHDLVVLNHSNAIGFSIGVCGGTTSWFWLLVGILRRQTGRFRKEHLELVVRALGFLLIGMGLSIAVSRFFPRS